MNVVLAVALLIWLLSRAGKRRGARRADKPDWIDELELLDAATDDFV